MQLHSVGSGMVELQSRVFLWTALKRFDQENYEISSQYSDIECWYSTSQALNYKLVTDTKWRGKSTFSIFFFCFYWLRFSAALIMNNFKQWTKSMNAVRISLRSKVHLLAFRTHFLPSIVHGTRINQLERMLLVFQMFTSRIQPLKQGQNKLRSLSVINHLDYDLCYQWSNIWWKQLKINFAHVTK